MSAEPPRDWVLSVKVPDGDWVEVADVVTDWAPQFDFGPFEAASSYALADLAATMVKFKTATEETGARLEALAPDLDKPTEFRRPPYPGARSFAHRGRK